MDFEKFWEKTYRTCRNLEFIFSKMTLASVATSKITYPIYSKNYQKNRLGVQMINYNVLIFFRNMQILKALIF